MYVLAPMLTDVDTAACYLAVSCKEPSDEFVQRAVAQNVIDMQWCTTHKYAVICGAAEAGNVELFWGLARRRNYENIIMQICCHPVIWNKLRHEVRINAATLLLNRVTLGYPLTGCNENSDDVQWICDQHMTSKLIQQSHAYMRKSTIDWLVHNDIPTYWIMTGVCNLDDADLAQYMLDNGVMSLDELRSCLGIIAFSDLVNPRLWTWYESMV